MYTLRVLNKTTVGEAKIGLFQIEDSKEIICISEYRSKSVCGVYSRDAYIVSSGENYWGGDDLKGHSLEIEINK